MLENIFSGINLYLPLHLHAFEAKQKFRTVFDYSRRLISKTTAAAPLPGKSILPELYQNVSNR